MSWLGSTKTRSWLLQDSDHADGLFESVQTTPKKGFETEFNLPGGKRMRQYVRAIAVDEGGTQLSISAPVDMGDPEKMWAGKEKEDHHDSDHMDDGHGHEHSHSDPEADHHDSGYENLRQDMDDMQLLVVLGILAVITAVFVAFIAFGCRSMPFRRIRSEKDGLMNMGFRDDGSLRVMWNKARQFVPGRKKPWQEYSGVGRGRERGDSIGESSGEYEVDER
jgi:hypothetical protein